MSVKQFYIRFIALFMVSAMQMVAQEVGQPSVAPSFDKGQLCSTIKSSNNTDLSAEDKDAYFAECLQMNEQKLIEQFVEFVLDQRLYDFERYPYMIDINNVPEPLKTYLVSQSRDKQCTRVMRAPFPSDQKEQQVLLNECLLLPKKPGIELQWLALKMNEVHFRKGQTNDIDLARLPEPLYSYILPYNTCLVAGTGMHNNMYGQPHPHAQTLAPLLFKDCDVAPYDQELRAAWVSYYVMLPYSFFIDLSQDGSGPHSLKSKQWDTTDNNATMLPDMNRVPEKFREYLRTEDRSKVCKRVAYLPFVTTDQEYSTMYDECMRLPNRLDIEQQWLAFHMRPYHFSKDLKNKVIYEETTVEPLRSYLKQRSDLYTIYERPKPPPEPNAFIRFFQMLGEAFKKFGEKVKNAFETFGEKIKEAFEKLGNIFKAIPEKLMQSAMSTIKLNLDGVKQGIEDAKNAVPGIIDSINAIKDSVEASNSPLKQSEQIVQSINNIKDAIGQQGFDFAAVTNALQTGSGQMGASFNTLQNAINGMDISTLFFHASMVCKNSANVIKAVAKIRASAGSLASIVIKGSAVGALENLEERLRALSLSLFALPKKSLQLRSKASYSNLTMQDLELPYTPPQATDHGLLNMDNLMKQLANAFFDRAQNIDPTLNAIKTTVGTIGDRIEKLKNHIPVIMEKKDQLLGTAQGFGDRLKDRIVERIKKMPLVLFPPAMIAIVIKEIESIIDDLRDQMRAVIQEASDLVADMGNIIAVGVDVTQTLRTNLGVEIIPELTSILPDIKQRVEDVSQALIRLKNDL